MLDLASDHGKTVVSKLLQKADIALANKHDAQLESIGVGRDTLNNITDGGGLGEKIIQLQVSARRGEQSEGIKDANWPGYDPALQGKCGIMERFGPPGCPTFHGVASCVDYLCGYTAAFAGVSALYSREAHGTVAERCGTSLAACATLVQCTMQGGEQYPDTARGPWSVGRTASNRIYQVGPGHRAAEHWIFAQGDGDITEEARNFMGSREEFIERLSARGVLATPVHTCKQIAEISKTGESKTLHFEKREAEGLLTETWKPTWLCYDGVPSECPGAAAPSGVHAPKILMEMAGYSEDEVYAMYGRGTVLPIYWDKNNTASEAHVWPDQLQSQSRQDMDTTTFKYNDPASGRAM
jgi:crotonobetainyl-CoA:carnitine CoA-transferase CaiB-like acyl-CoA transferase